MRGKSYFVIIFFSACSILMQANYSTAQDKQWSIIDKRTIVLDIDQRNGQAYSDNIEMAGKRVAAIVSYDIDTAGTLSIERQVIFPQLHPFIKSNDPNWYIYRAYAKRNYKDDILPQLFIGDKRFAPGKLKKVTIDGKLNFEYHPSKSGIRMVRKLMPSPSERLFVEYFTIHNTTDSVLEVQTVSPILQYEDFGKEGKFTTQVISDIADRFDLSPGDSLSFSTRITAQKEGEGLPQQASEEVLKERQIFLNQMANSLTLETPDAVLNTLFEFSKIRASESIFESKLGLIHSPGGGRYYVGIWANDQAEYVSPFFPYLGYDIGNQSALNTYRAFAGETTSDFKNIRYAFEIEGTVPPFSLDRGDAAMIAYGASQFALALGDKTRANELWPLIKWCLEYCERQLNANGVVKSESDEMEGRIETGTANLSTSSLYYGALNLAADLVNALGKPKSLSKNYRKQAKALDKSIEQYFGANVEGLDTYRYYDGHQYLRHWICLPLVVGINDRKEETIEALFDRLWTENGVHVEKNSENEAISEIFWDRGTLYALRGTFLAGATERSLKKLQSFSQKRLLGDRVPYVVEAYPEGDMAHLSAESGLYCRVFIEGMFGVIPTGFDSFQFTPRLPKDWDHMALRSIKAFGSNFDIVVEREANDQINVKILDQHKKALLNKTIKQGEAVDFNFNQ